MSMKPAGGQSTILDDFSRYIVAWMLCTTMKVEDVTDALNLALATSGCDTARVEHKPRLLSNNGPATSPPIWAIGLNSDPSNRCTPNLGHSQTQGKIERWHQTLKNRILLEKYYFSQDLEAPIAAFVDQYNHRRYRGSLGNLTPADVCFGRGHTILLEIERIKRDTINSAACNIVSERLKSKPNNGPETPIFINPI